MYKEIIICTIIVIFIIVLNVVTQKYTENSTNIIITKLDELQQIAKNENIENNKLNNKKEELQKNWDERKRVLEYYIEHDELEKVGTEIKSINANIEVEEYEDVVVDAQKAIFILEHIKEKYSLKIQNIF